LVGEKLEKLGVNVATLNFGSGGQNLNHSTIKYISIINQVEPRYVIVNHQANDMAKFMKGGYYIRETSLHDSYDKTLRGNFSSRIRNIISNMFPYTYYWFRNYRNTSYSPPDRIYSSDFIGLDAAESSKEFSSRILALSEIVKPYNGKVIVIDYPEIFDTLLKEKDDFNLAPRSEIEGNLHKNGLTTDEFLTYKSLFKSTLKDILTSNNISFVSAQSAELDKQDFYDAIHFTPSGSKKFSNYLTKELEGLIDC
jgi:hypothetical protein